LSGKSSGQRRVGQFGFPDTPRLTRSGSLGNLQPRTRSSRGSPQPALRTTRATCRRRDPKSSEPLAMARFMRLGFLWATGPSKVPRVRSRVRMFRQSGGTGLVRVRIDAGRRGWCSPGQRMGPAWAPKDGARVNQQEPDLFTFVETGSVCSRIPSAFDAHLDRVGPPRADQRQSACHGVIVSEPVGSRW